MNGTVTVCAVLPAVLLTTAFTVGVPTVGAAGCLPPESFPFVAILCAQVSNDYPCIFCPFDECNIRPLCAEFKTRCSVYRHTRTSSDGALTSVCLQNVYLTSNREGDR